MKCAECLHYEVCADVDGEACEYFKEGESFGRLPLRERETGIMEAALEQWGVEKQTLKAIEEMSELQKELCKWRVGDSSAQNIAEEISDVRIMLDQMELALGIEWETARWRQRKLSRLHRRLAGIKGKKEDGKML